MKVLVTGSSGYIGSVLTPYLEDAGFECVGRDTGFFAHCHLYPPPGGAPIFQDARDIEPADLDGIDVVVHLAGISNDPMGQLDAATVYDPTRAYARRIAQMCKDRGVRFVFASSCSIYGVGGDQALDEDSEVHPQTGYSLNKFQVEQDLRELADESFSPIALRFATIFGSSPRIRLDVVINMFTAMAVSTGRIVLNSDGTAWRPNLHILDACQAIRRAIESEYDGGELLVLNVGSDANNLQVIEMARIVADAVPGVEVSFLGEDPNLDRDGLIADRKVKKGGTDTRTYQVSFARIAEAFPGFECEWSVADGVRQMVDRFETIGMNESVFRRRGFYRLQELEHLLAEGYIDTDLRWLRERPEPAVSLGIEQTA